MLPKAKEKLNQQEQQQQQQLLQKDDIKCRELIANFKKSIELWFTNIADDEITFGEIQDTCLEIILHGLHDPNEMFHIHNKDIKTIIINDSPSPSSSSSSTHKYPDVDLYALLKRIDDFEWILNSVNIWNSSGNSSSRKNTKCLDVVSTPPSTSFNYSDEMLLSMQRNFLSRHRLESNSNCNSNSLLKGWLKLKLNQLSTLGSFMQYLIADKELLDEHYTVGALLKQKKYINALVIGLSALETCQFGLLTLIDDILKEGDITDTSRHKRSSSQPNITVMPAKKQTIVKNVPHQTVFPCIRKTKSLPEFKNRYTDSLTDYVDGGPRRRCKTLMGIKRKYSRPKNIPRIGINLKEKPNFQLGSSSTSSSSYYDDDQKPSTSSRNPPTKQSPMSIDLLNSSTSITSNNSYTSASLCSSSNSNTTSRRIQIINTDDIKIWTDQSWESRKKSVHGEKTLTPSQVIPKTKTKRISSSVNKSSKSVSPLNTFFSSLFTTPPSYTSWYTDHSSREDDEDEEPETAVESITSENPSPSKKTTTQNPSPSCVINSTTVFDKFLPIDGKKLRTRKSQNLFDDIVNTSPVPLSSNCQTFSEAKHECFSSPNNNNVSLPKNCESLTQFLQMSNLSRNNTELEKENAHFRISEAIISAIEHIKWNKQQPRDINNRLHKEATPLATDCLSTSQQSNKETISKSECFKGGEHVPYAEEVCPEPLSAEVVGLSLIAKFDEKHLPKVSELKWLVSDDDTPQKLLPMPDLTSSKNPDDHIIHSVTRGTKYWAPPRQQIIFTDHPTPDRKDLLKKQNFRCAGCGMRVSPQYVHSFRYCTYLGKYHCTGCHRNQISATPAKILHAWDFKCYPVSVFAYRLLEQMSSYPLFYVPDLNPALYNRSKNLLSARNKRLQLKYIKDFICTCRFAVREKYYFETVPDYITSDVDNWSMADFIDAQSNCLHRSIDELLSKCESHIFDCVLCTARGFLCEHCRSDSVIYPWDSRVERCDRCGSCFHRSCWKNITQICFRCQRIDKRLEYDEIPN